MIVSVCCSVRLGRIQDAMPCRRLIYNTFVSNATSLASELSSLFTSDLIRRRCSQSILISCSNLQQLLITQQRHRNLLLPRAATKKLTSQRFHLHAIHFLLPQKHTDKLVIISWTGIHGWLCCFFGAWPRRASSVILVRFSSLSLSPMSSFNC
jgi:hypothetical protein